jgi:hypothetical protein
MIGITERGDAGKDLSWSAKMSTVDGAILITKNVDNPVFIAEVAKHNNVIVHATITGHGDSILEANVSPPAKTIEAITSLMLVQPVDRIVLRVDPIIPTERGINTAIGVIRSFAERYAAIRRVRFSFMDLYPHVKGRFVGAGVQVPWETFHSPPHMQQEAINALSSLATEYGLIVESCGEGSTSIPSDWKVGCVSARDYDILGIQLPQSQMFGGQRKNCLCLGSKKELLTSRSQCPNHCLYCYWR